MGCEVDLLRSIPRPKRNLAERSQSRNPNLVRESECVAESRLKYPCSY